MMTPSEIVQFLKVKVPLFAGFTPERLGPLIGGSQKTSYEANEAIVYHGEEAAHFGVVLAGTVVA